MPALPRPTLPRPVMPLPGRQCTTRLVASATGLVTGVLADAYGRVSGAASSVRGAARVVVLHEHAEPQIGSNPKRRYGSGASRDLAR